MPALFVLQGGDPGSYMVTGDPGTLVGNTFTSAPIASDSSYTFNIFDGNACDTLMSQEFTAVTV
ncbi:MAG: hypothetical protein R2769_14250 [Saprospiraceae bacterium]